MLISSRNVNTMLPAVMEEFHRFGLTGNSRNGPVIRLPEPTVLKYTNPFERVCFDATRDANPYFHFMESMWMLAGRRDVAFVAFYNSGMAQYSDDGLVFNAAYGYRMRRHFGFDQLLTVVDEIRKNTETRQAVINLWDPADLSKTTKDKACNLSLLFSLGAGSNRLDLTVFNRSNDAVWGAVTGANPVHMSYFHQFVCEASGMSPGCYYQVSNNLHLYLENEKSKLVFGAAEFDSDRYDEEIEVPILIDLEPTRWLEEVEIFCDMAGTVGLVTPRFQSKFLNGVAVPIHNSFASRKAKDYRAMHDWLEDCDDRAWAVACGEWCVRRTK